MDPPGGTRAAWTSRYDQRSLEVHHHEESRVGADGQRPHRNVPGTAPLGGASRWAWVMNPAQPTIHGTRTLAATPPTTQAAVRFVKPGRGGAAMLWGSFAMAWGSRSMGCGGRSGVSGDRSWEAAGPRGSIASNQRRAGGVARPRGVVWRRRGGWRWPVARIRFAAAHGPSYGASLHAQFDRPVRAFDDPGSTLLTRAGRRPAAYRAGPELAGARIEGRGRRADRTSPRALRHATSGGVEHRDRRGVGIDLPWCLAREAWRDIAFGVDVEQLDRHGFRPGLRRANERAQHCFGRLGEVAQELVRRTSIDGPIRRDVGRLVARILKEPDQLLTIRGREHQWRERIGHE